MKNYLPFLFICTFSFLSCSTDDDTKEYYFEARLDSEEWNKTNAEPEIIFDEEENYFVLRSKKDIDQYNAKHFLIVFENPNEVKNYTMGLQYIQGGDLLLSLYGAESINEGNSLTIIEFNEEENYITGEFQAQLLHSGGELWDDNESYQLEGKFRLPVEN